MNKLCCELTPCYECRACGFKECNPCYETRFIGKDRSFHVIGKEGLLSPSYCATTNIEIWPEKKKDEPLSSYTIWIIRTTPTK